jgi:hypothetical protein
LLSWSTDSVGRVLAYLLPALARTIQPLFENQNLLVAKTDTISNSYHSANISSKLEHTERSTTGYEIRFSQKILIELFHLRTIIRCFDSG